MNIEAQKRNFKDHVAKLSDYGNIKVLDFKNPNSNNYRIRFIFEEDYCRLHISGDLGSLSATNYNNMTYENFDDFVHNVGYFTGKINCSERPLYEYNEETAREEIKEHIKDCFDDEDDLEDTLDSIMEDFDENTGFGSKAYDIISEYDPDCWDYISRTGREETGILELYMLAFELAKKQLEEN